MRNLDALEAKEKSASDFKPDPDIPMPTSEDLSAATWPGKMKPSEVTFFNPWNPDVVPKEWAGERVFEEIDYNNPPDSMKAYEENRDDVVEPLHEDKSRDNR